MPTTEKGWLYWKDVGETFDLRFREYYQLYNNKPFIGKVIWRHIFRGGQRPFQCYQNDTCPFCKKGWKPTARYVTQVEMNGKLYNTELQASVGSQVAEKQRDLERCKIPKEDILATVYRIRKVDGRPFYEVSILQGPLLTPPPETHAEVLEPGIPQLISRADVAQLQSFETNIKAYLVKNPSFRFRESIEATLRARGWSSDKRQSAQKFYTDSGEFVMIADLVE